MKIIRLSQKEDQKELNNGWEKRKSVWVKEVTCTDSDPAVCGHTKGCGAIIEISEKDLAVMYWYGTHFKHEYFAFQCPCCHKYNSVGQVPDRIFNRFTLRKAFKKAIFDGFDDRI